jgi:undecaprenyl-diphosphatase
VTEYDAHLFRILHQALSGGAVVLFVMAALTVVGSGWSMLAFLPLLVRRATRRFGGALVGTLVATSLVVFTIKHLARRARPCACLEGVQALVFAAPTDPSFPSGHAAGSFAFAAFVAVVLLRGPARSPRQWLLAAAVLLLASGVALSRVALGVHFPGDVAGGALIGGVMGAYGAFVSVRRRWIGAREA